jgi:inner membrane protein
MVAQQHVLQHAHTSLRAAGLSTEQVFATPAPFSTALWRVVAVDGDHMHEGFYALLDGGRPIRFDSFDRGTALLTQNADHPQVQRLHRFTDGFVSLRQDAKGDLWISDWRMGPVATQERRVMDVGAGLIWLGTRMRGTDIDPPRGP